MKIKRQTSILIAAALSATLLAPASFRMAADDNSFTFVSAHMGPPKSMPRGGRVGTALTFLKDICSAINNWARVSFEISDSYYSNIYQGVYNSTNNTPDTIVEQVFVTEEGDVEYFWGYWPADGEASANYDERPMVRENTYEKCDSSHETGGGVMMYNWYSFDHTYKARHRYVITQDAEPPYSNPTEPRQYVLSFYGDVDIPHGCSQSNGTALNNSGVPMYAPRDSWASFTPWGDQSRVEKLVINGIEFCSN